jgi:hypothetical protein
MRLAGSKRNVKCKPLGASGPRTRLSFTTWTRGPARRDEVLSYVNRGVLGERRPEEAHDLVLAQMTKSGSRTIGPPDADGYVRRLTRAPVVSIAKIRGCVRGASGEFVLA